MSNTNEWEAVGLTPRCIPATLDDLLVWYENTQFHLQFLEKRALWFLEVRNDVKMYQWYLEKVMAHYPIIQAIWDKVVLSAGLAECFALLEENMQSTNRLYLDLLQGELE